MQLMIMCRSCLKYFGIKAKASSRPELIRETGEYFNRACPKCHKQHEYHVNDVKAYNSFGANIIGTVIGVAIIVVFTVFAWDQGVITNVGLIIGGGIIFASNLSLATSNATAFNKYRVRPTIRE